MTTIHLKMHITVVIIAQNPPRLDPPKKKVVQKVGGVQAKVGGSGPPDPPVVAPLDFGDEISTSSKPGFLPSKVCLSDPSLRITQLALAVLTVCHSSVKLVFSAIL